MHIALCDDSPLELDELRAQLEEYGRRREVPPFTYTCYGDGQALLHAAEETVFDLCLLDILMPGLSGIETARRLRALRPAAAVIFLTSAPDFALDAFQVRAKNYLLKPVRREALWAALDEVFSAPRLLPVEIASEGGAVVVVPSSRILYLECADHRIVYHLTDGTQVCGRTLRIPFLTAAAPLLESGRFLQPHRSYLVNAEHVSRFSGQAVVLVDGTELAVSQLRRKDFRLQYMRFLAGEAT